MENIYPALYNRFNHVFNVIHSECNNVNIVVSTLSIHACFALLAEGTSGHTFAELQAAFGFGNHPYILDSDLSGFIREILEGKSQSVVVKMDNSIYSCVSIHKDYIDTLRTKYLALAKTVDFASPNTVIEINDRISECTNGLLKNTVGKLSPSTVCVLLNTIYFKGEWKVSFDKSLTSKGAFKSIDGVKQVDFMLNFGLKCGYYLDGEVKYLAIPYKGGDVKFVIEMRTKGTPSDSNHMNVVKTALLTEEVCEVLIPKFKASFKTSLNSIMKKLGVNSIFKPSADFDKISSGSIFVSDIIHQAFIQVDEEGTEAAAVTVIKMEKSVSKAAKKVPVFVADRPFHYHIVNKTKQVILFSGTIYDPQF